MDETSEPTASCGDGIVQGDEECDDANEDYKDSCLPDCTLATCGDQAVRDGVEECDDGNLVDTDYCTSLCRHTRCGDGFTGPNEKCDDGNSSDSDNCTNSCLLAQCGDGIVNGMDSCDDGAQQAGDPCSSSCAETKIIDISLGFEHMCVVFATGKLRCWGANSWGQLGYGHELNLGDQENELPTPDLTMDGKVLDVELGGHHTCVLLEDGDISCWGYNEFGQLGRGDTEKWGYLPRHIPAPKLALGVKVLEMAAGGRFTCVRVEQGGVRCWGRGLDGSLGDGLPDNVGDQPGELPTKDIPGTTGAKSVVAGEGHVCALVDGGKVQCWGENDLGQLGLGHTDTIGDGKGEMPPLLLALGDVPVVQVAAGHFHTCVLLDNGNVRCWGAAWNGRLGYALPEESHIGDGPGEMPPPNVNVGGSVAELVLGAHHTCVRLDTGKVKCWGSGHVGALGYGNQFDVGKEIKDMPPGDVELGGLAERLVGDLATGTCAVLVGGTLRCWGDNYRGQFGYGHMLNIGDDETPVQVDPLPY